jgi:transposase
MQARRKAVPKRHSSGSVSEIQELRRELRAEKLAREKAERENAYLKNEIERLWEELRKESEARQRKEEFLQKEIRKLQKDVADRDLKLEKANKQLVWFRKNFFGSRSEKDATKEEQDEELAKAQESAQQEPGRRSRGQQPDSKGHGRTDRSGVPVSETVTLGIPGGCTCPECGTPYQLLATTEDSPVVEIAVSLFQMLYKLQKYVSQCRCKGKQIITTPPPPKLYPKTTIGNSLWVHLTVQKFLQGTPTNRTLKELSLYGFSLAEGTVTGGLKVIDGLLETLYEEMVNHCRGADLWNADETSWRVFDAGKKRWWLWVIASDDAVVHVLDPSRSKKVPTDFFSGSAGVLMTDRLSSYKALHDAIKKAWCWVHQRRDFLNVYNSNKKLKQWAKTWLKEIATLFVLNDKRFQLWQQDKALGPEWDKAQAKVEQHVERLKDKWERELKKPKLHDEQKKILRSMNRHWEGLTLFVEDPRIPLHNNRAERLLRNAVILRKNSYGSGSKWAGSLATKLFSIFQTWLINGLDPQAMLLDYFNECSKTPGSPPADVSQFMPWSMSPERKRELALPKSYKSPG